MRTARLGVALLVGLSLFPLGQAFGSGALPIYPNPYSAVAHATLGAATNGTYAYSQTLSASERLNTTGPTVSCAPDTCYQLKDAWANVSNPFSLGLPSSAVPYAHATWINVTTGCGNMTCPAGFLQCDQTFYSFQSAASTMILRPCFAVGVLWSSGTAGQIDKTRGATLPRYSVTRLLTYSASVPVTWTPSGLHAVAAIDVPSPSPAIYGPLGTTHLTAWSVPSVWLAVPYPIGRWNLPATVVTWQNQSVTVPIQNVSYQSNALLLQWAAFPTSFCASCGPTGTSVNESYQISLLSLSGTPNLKGGNSSLVVRPPPPAIAPTSIVVFLGNVTQTSSTTFTSTVDWTNPTSANFTGAIVAQAGFLGTATNVRVVVNAAVIPSTDYTVTTGAVELLPGSVTVAGTSTVTILVGYTAVPTGSPNSVLLIIDGFSFTVSDGILLAGLILAGAYIAYWVERKQPSLIADDVLSLGIFVIAISSAVALSG